MSFIIDIFSYDFLVRAVIVGLLISLCSSLLGVSLVLKRYSMIGDGLSHVGFGTVAVATALGLAPTAVAIPVVILVAFLILKLNQNTKIKGDAAIALISSGSLAIGVTAVSVTGLNTDINSFLFGSILAVDKSDLVISVILTSVVLILFVLFYNKLFAVTFDENFSKATGVKTDFYNMLLAALTAVTVVVGLRLVGALLISSLIVFPSLTSMRLCKNFKSVTITTAIVAVLSFLIGIFISYAYSLPTGASIVLVNIAAFLVFSLISKFRGCRP